MKLKLLGVDITISVPFCAMVAFLLILDRTGMMAVALFATAIHELGHLVFMFFLHQLPVSIALYPARIKIVKATSPCGYKTEMLIAFSGPLFNLLTCLISLLLYRFVSPLEPFLIVGAVNIAVFVFQMLPITGLDGGDVFKYLLIQVFSLKTASVICIAVSGVLIIFLTGAGIVLFWTHRANPTLILTSLYLAALMIVKVTSKEKPFLKKQRDGGRTRVPRS